MARSNDNLLLGLTMLGAGLQIGAALAEPPRSHRVVYYTHSPRWDRYFNVQASGYTYSNDLRIDGKRAYGSEHLTPGSHTATCYHNGRMITKRFDAYSDRVVEISVASDGEISLRTHR